MGLTINSFINAIKSTDEADNSIELVNQDDCRKNVAEPGWYLAEETNFRWDGTYHGYNRFRSWLCMCANQITDESVWANPTDDISFLELVDFPDNWGGFDTSICKSLSDEFEAWKPTFERLGYNKHEYYEDYLKIAECFKVAAEGGGFVVFN